MSNRVGEYVGRHMIPGWAAVAVAVAVAAWLAVAVAVAVAVVVVAVAVVIVAVAGAGWAGWSVGGRAGCDSLWSAA